MIHTYSPLPRTEMAPAMLVIILKVVRLRNHQILAKIPEANQAGRPEANPETMRMKAKNCLHLRKIPICITLFSIPTGGTGDRLYEERGKNTVYYPAYTSFTKSGYAFLGWADRKTAETVLYADGSPIPVTNNRILYAVWIPENEAYTVTFDLKGGIDNGMPETLSCRPGGSILLPSLNNTYKAGFVRDGYSPDGTAASGLLKAETEFFPTTDTTLCVVWGDGSSSQYAGGEKWVRGVTVTPQDWKTWWSEYGEKTAFWRPDTGWYDVYQGNKELCWAAVASDMLLWWYNTNRDAVDAYIVAHPERSPFF